MELLSTNSKHTGLCKNQTEFNASLNLIINVAKGVVKGHSAVDYRDLIYPGFMALDEARKRFKPEMRVKFSTYASNYMRGKMLDECRYLEQTVCIPRHYANEVSFSSFESSDYEPFSMEAYYETEDEEWYAEAVVQVRNAKEQLPSKQRFVVDCRIGCFGKTMTYAQIGKMLNSSPQNAQQEFNRGVETLRGSVDLYAFAA